MAGADTRTMSQGGKTQNSSTERNIYPLTLDIIHRGEDIFLDVLEGRRGLDGQIIQEETEQQRQREDEEE